MVEVAVAVRTVVVLAWTAWSAWIAWEVGALPCHTSEAVLG